MAEKGIQPDLIYTSEEADAPQYMEHLGIETVLVDPKRTFMSISGAQIRENPFRYWGIYSYGSEAILCAYRGDPRW
ncbi:transcriptional regulator [Escherichia coli]|uniref:Transcriptional regulator n=1 Tax=Escherichia coli TaxID=562 RepID=A0A484YK05_ECOLX|nr:transcriptional regulator [Escherichia coli]